MERVKGRDAIFLYVETAQNTMHMVFCIVLDPSTIPGGKATHPRDIYQRFRDLLSERLHLFPPFRQRLVEVPFDLHHPVLIEDAAFDIDFHIRRAALPAPGGKRELEEFVSDIASRPMDRNRPLWEMHLVEGLGDGRWALVAKAHHLVIDGVGGTEVLVNVVDLEPEPRQIEPPDEVWEPEDIPSDPELVLRAVAENLKSPPRVVRGVARTAGTLLGIARDRIASGDDTLATLGPRTVLNQTKSARRHVAMGRVPFEEVRAVKDAFGVKVNDVVLAMTGRALRRFLVDLGDEPDRPLVAAVPISVRDGEGEGGNRVAGMTVPMFDDLDDVGEQLRRINEATRPTKDRMGAITADLMRDWTEFTTPTLAVSAFRFYSGFDLYKRHRPVANITISNIPGPDIPLYIAGSEVQSMYPFGPIIWGQAVNVTVVTHRGTMFLGAIADREVVHDVSPLVDHMEKTLGELLEAASNV